jgi:hypothetical protein
MSAMRDQFPRPLAMARVGHPLSLYGKECSRTHAVSLTIEERRRGRDGIQGTPLVAVLGVQVRKRRRRTSR